MVISIVDTGLGQRSVSEDIEAEKDGFLPAHYAARRVRWWQAHERRATSQRHAGHHLKKPTPR